MEDGKQEPLAILPHAPITWPEDGVITRQWLCDFTTALDYASRHLPDTQLTRVVPVETADSLLMAAYKIMHKELNIVEVKVHECPGAKATLVGDVHGQFHDVIKLFDMAGTPGDDSFFVFNGDYVDRGAWGVETYLYLLAWKVFLPSRIFLLRGNHETRYCVRNYGFEREVMIKFASHGPHVFRKLLGSFESHPLAAIVGGCVYIAHGGLFRDPLPHPRRGGGGGGGRKLSFRGGKKKDSKRVGSAGDSNLRLGNLSDLAKCRRSVLDPGGGSSTLPADVLWSDPGLEEGLSLNRVRGVGLLFGPDCTQQFLVENDLKLIVRSHEGPDARCKRPLMPSMVNGFSVDHQVAAGQLITLFSAPDYPQFQTGKRRYGNKGAFLVLKPPDFSIPEFHTFKAHLPRPPATAYYDYENALDSDEDLGLDEGSEGDTTSSCGGSESDSERKSPALGVYE